MYQPALNRPLPPVPCGCRPCGCLCDAHAPDDLPPLHRLCPSHAFRAGCVGRDG